MAGSESDQSKLELADMPGVGAYLWSISDDRVVWSPELIRVYGLGHGPPSEHRFIELVHPEDRLRVEAETTAFLDSGDDYQHEFRIVRPDGEVRVIHDRGIIERAANGAALRFRGINIDITSQRAISARDQGERTRDLLELALDAAGQGVWEYDIAEDRPSWDPTTCRLFGRPVGDPLSFERVVGEFVHPEDRDRVADAARSAMDPSGSGRYSVEHRVVHQGGQVRWLAVQGRAIFDGTGPDRRAVRMFGTARDITARRHAMAALQEGRELLRMALDTAGMGIWQSDFDRGVAECDATTRRLFGIEAGQGQLPLVDIESRIHPGDIGELRAAWDSLDVGQTFRREFRVRGDDTGERWLLGVGEKRIAGADGRVIAVGLNIDVTEQKRTEARLRQSAALFRNMADNLPHMVWLHDAEGRQEFVNQTFCDYFGVTREEMREDKWQVLMHPEDAEAYAAEFAACVREQKPFHAEVRVQRGDGEWRWLESWGTPRFDEAGHYLGQVGTSADVTDRKREEQLRHLLLEELNHRVRNTFALIQAIANQSLRGDRQIELQRAAFTGRLRALASANDLLTRENWEKASLSQLISDARTASGTADGRFTAEGPEVILQPRQAISLALALHELCTNAIKYGALSGNRGRVAVRWTLREGEPEHLTLNWTEHDGPPVSPPRTGGFGTRLLERALVGELGARVGLDFRPEGLRCTIDCDLG